MTKNRFFPLALIGLIAFVSATVPVRAEELLSRADGNWSGSGWFRNGMDAPKEAARCRYKNSISSSGDELAISGKCSLANRTFRTSGTITYSGSGGRFTGGLSNPRGPGTITLQGQKSGSQITFTFRAKDESTGKYLPHRSTWTISESRLRLVGSVRNPETGRFSDLSVMEFSR